MPVRKLACLSVIGEPLTVFNDSICSDFYMLTEPHLDVCILVCSGVQSFSTCLAMQGWGNRIDDGDVDVCFESGECDHVIEGVAKMGGQDHFYLEPHGSITVPLENNEIKIYASTQVGFFLPLL